MKRSGWVRSSLSSLCGRFTEELDFSLKNVHHAFAFFIQTRVYTIIIIHVYKMSPPRPAARCEIEITERRRNRTATRRVSSIYSQS